MTKSKNTLNCEQCGEIRITREKFTEHSIERQSLQSEIAHLQNQIATLQKDKERMDWLESAIPGRRWHLSVRKDNNYLGLKCGMFGDYHENTHQSAREAIDKAMNASDNASE